MYETTVATPLLDVRGRSAVGTFIQIGFGRISETYRPNFTFGARFANGNTTNMINMTPDKLKAKAQKTVRPNHDVFRKLF